MGKELISLDCVFIVHSRWLKKHFELTVWNISHNPYSSCNNNKSHYSEFNAVLLVNYMYLISV